MNISEPQTRILRFGVIAVIVVVIAFIWITNDDTRRDNVGDAPGIALMGSAAKAQMYEPAYELASTHGFINTDPITVSEFIGEKVILVDFWTYSCINCQRTLPYLNDWWDTYKDKGLIILGVHTPEFTFEEKLANVQSAVDKYEIGYPVILDNDYATWDAYKNRYWPRKYLVDIDGYIVYDHIGEGGYEKTEKKIQELLAERAVKLGLEMDADVAIETPEGVDIVDSSQVGSPEIYFGASRNEYLGNGTPGTVGMQSFTEPEKIQPNTLYFSGDWDLDSESATNLESGAKIIFQYQAKKVHFVGSSENGVNLRIFQDGKEVNQVNVQIDDLYTLISDDDYGVHTLEIIVDDPGLNAFTFTFG